MSTSFRVLGPEGDKPDTPVLEVTEHSGKFDVEMWTYQHDEHDQCAHSFEIGNLTPDELADTGLRLIQIACYQGRDLLWKQVQADLARLQF